MEALSTDPIDWSVDDVVAFLCNPESAPWAQSLSSARPDPAALEAALHDSLVSGEVLLHDVDSDAIKNDLGVKALGHRSSLTRAIEWLRLRSPKYQMSKKSLTLANEWSTAIASHKESLSSHPSTPVITPSIPAATTSLAAPSLPGQPTGLPGKRRVAPTLVSGPEELNIRQLPAKSAGDQVQTVAPSLSAIAATGGRNITPAGFDQCRNDTESSMGGTEMPQTLDLNRDWFTAKLEQELLQKHPPGDDDEEPLPVYGESGSENDWDSQEWQELLHERPHLGSEESNSPQAQGSLSHEVLESIILRYIDEQNEVWKNESLPKELPFARPLWERSREGDNLDRIANEVSDRLYKHEQYLSKLKKSILDTQYKSEASVLRSCPALDPTLSQTFLERWRLSVLEMELCPPEAELPRIRRSSKKRLDSVESARSEESSEDLGSGSESNGFTDDDDMEDFIVEDDANNEPEMHSQETSQGFPFALDSSASSDNEDLSDSNLDSPVRKRRRVTEYGENEDENGESGGLDSTLSQLEQTEDSGSYHALPSPNQNTPVTTQEFANTEDMDISTPPLNPMYLENPEDADVTAARLSPELVNQAPDLLPPKIASPANPSAEEGLQPDLASSENHADTSDPDVNPDDVELFTMLRHLGIKSIEAEKNRIHLLAKIVMNLTAAEIGLFSSFLTKYIEDIYKEYVQEALQAMLKHERQVEGRDPEESLLAMRMAAMFVSWFHCIALQPTVSHKRFIQEALEALEDGVTNLFSSFYKRLKSLIAAVQVWAFSEQSRGLYDENQPEAPSSSNPTMNHPGTKKRGRPLSTQQKEAYDRQVLQDKMREQLRRQREKEGLSNSDPTKYMVTFKEPIVYLHPHIGALVKPHQLRGIQFMWRELIEAENPQGCMLAHVMGLGKTMQVSVAASLSCPAF